MTTSSPVRSECWHELVRHADPVARVAELARTGSLRLRVTIAPDDATQRATVEAVLRLAAPDEPCPPTRGQVLAVVLGARVRVVCESVRSAPWAVPVATGGSPAARAFLHAWRTNPPSWCADGALPLEEWTIELAGASVAAAVASSQRDDG